MIRRAKAAGRGLPKIKICEGLSEEEAFELERLFIAAIGRTKNGGPLFNQTDGGDGPIGYEFTDEARQKNSEAQKRRFSRPEERELASIARTGILHSPEGRAKIKAAMNSQEVRAKISAGLNRAVSVMTDEERRKTFGAHNKGRKRSAATAEKQRRNNPGNTGHKHSEETRRRLSERTRALWARRKGAASSFAHATT